MNFELTQTAVDVAAGVTVALFVQDALGLLFGAFLVAVKSFVTRGDKGAS